MPLYNVEIKINLEIFANTKEIAQRIIKKCSPYKKLCGVSQEYGWYFLETIGEQEVLSIKRRSKKGEKHDA